MINSIWSNRDVNNPIRVVPPIVGPDAGIKLLITDDVARTGILPIVLDLGAIHNLGEESGIELEVLANGTPPGAGAKLTVYAGFSSVKYRTPVQLASGAASQICDISALAANSLFQFLLPVFLNGARYLYIWFDHTNLAAGATLELTVRVNSRTEDS